MRFLFLAVCLVNISIDETVARTNETVARNERLFVEFNPLKWPEVNFYTFVNKTLLSEALRRV